MAWNDLASPSLNNSSTLSRPYFLKMPRSRASTYGMPLASIVEWVSLTEVCSGLGRLTAAAVGLAAAAAGALVAAAAAVVGFEPAAGAVVAVGCAGGGAVVGLAAG